jgi:hypothetical protein
LGRKEIFCFSDGAGVSNMVEKDPVIKAYLGWLEEHHTHSHGHTSSICKHLDADGGKCRNGVVGSLSLAESDESGDVVCTVGGCSGCEVRCIFYKPSMEKVEKLYEIENKRVKHFLAWRLKTIDDWEKEICDTIE